MLRGAVAEPLFGTVTASAFALLTLLRGTVTGPLCGGTPMPCLGVVCSAATAVPSPPATADSPLSEPASPAILLVRKPTFGKAMLRNYLSVSCNADERDEAAKLRAHDAAHCVLCAVCMCSALCVCVVLCAVCMCSAVCVVLCVLCVCALLYVLCFVCCVLFATRPMVATLAHLLEAWPSATAQTCHSSSVATLSPPRRGSAATAAYPAASSAATAAYVLLLR